MGKEKDRLDVMLDIETLGVNEGSIILSVAMKSFRLDGSIPSENLCFYKNINVLSSLMKHLRSDFATEEWWANQAEETRKRMMDGQRTSLDVDSVMRLVYEVLSKYHRQYSLYLWGRGVGSFDLPLLDYVMKLVVGDQYKTPWNYWSAVDVRSIVQFCGYCGMDHDKMATPHDAMEDVNKQILETQLCWQYVKVERAL